MGEIHGLCALALFLLAVSLPANPASCCAPSGVPAPLALTGLGCRAGPASAGSNGFSISGSGVAGGFLILGPAATAIP